MTRLETDTANVATARNALMKLSALAFVLIGLTIFWSQNAMALCRVDGPTPGTWINVDQNTGGIRRFYIGYSCNDVIAIPSDASPEDRARSGRSQTSGWKVAMWGKCHPRDCAWGMVPARQVRVGSRNNLVASYDQGFATRHIVIRQRGARLQLVMSSRYRDGRPTRNTSEWFVLHRAGS